MTAAVSLATLGNGPAFEATADGTQVIPSSTYVKVLFATEMFDTNNNYAASRFTPTVAGYYQINANTAFNTTGETVLAVYKNGSAFRYIWDMNATLTYTMSNSLLIYLNGTTDYIEIYLFQSSGSNKSPGIVSYFSGCLIKGA